HVTGDAQDAEPHVVVHPDDVGELVVQVVVGVFPVRRAADQVPLPGGRVDLRIVHPVPLAVHDVVAQFHVLEDLGHPQHPGADRPDGAVAGPEVQQRARADLQSALQADDAVDVLVVTRTARGQDLVADRVEFPSQLFDLLGGEVGVFTYIGDRHDTTLCVPATRGHS